MGQVLTPDNLPDLVLASSTTVTMATSYLGRPTRLTIGGQQFQYSSLVTLNFAATGLNGLDTGAIAANTLYYIYAVRSAGVHGLVASTSAPGTGPSGFTAWKEVARCRTFLGSASLAAVANRVGGTSGTESSEPQAYALVLNTNVNGLGGTAGIATNNSTRRRLGGSVMEWRGGFAISGAGAGTTELTLVIPGGFSIDATLMSSSLTSGTNNLGSFFFTTATMFMGGNAAIPSSSTAVRFLETDQGSILQGGDFTTGSQCNWLINIPIAEWKNLYT